MLYQIHQQSVGNLDKTILVAQGEPPIDPEKFGYELAEFLMSWFNKVIARNELLPGHQWLMCNEKSDYFVLASQQAGTVCVSSTNNERESMPGSVSDSYDPEWGTSSAKEEIIDALDGVYSKLSTILGNKPPMDIRKLVAIKESDEEITLAGSLQEKEWRLIRFAIERALDSL